MRVFNLGNRRRLREILTAYVMILPAGVLIFLFGIFPVGFALFVSLYQWRLKRGDFIGLANYVQSAGDLTYVMLIGLAALGGVVGFLFIRALLAYSRADGRRVWWFALPALALAGAAIGIVRWAYLALPPVLDIADKIVGQERTRELFVRLLREALATPNVVAAGWQSVILAALGLAAAVVVARLTASSRALEFTWRFSLLWACLGVSAFLAWTTLQSLRSASEASAVGAGALTTTYHTLFISAGVLLLVLAWLVWRSASRSESDAGFVWKLGAALLLLVGAWALIAEVPGVVAQGDPEMWEGLKLTVVYSVGTVPFQLAFGMLLAILLFQRLRGSEFFRMLFFLPYVTPVVASAAVFRQLFSTRLQAPANQVLKLLGVPGQEWLREPSGIFKLVADGLGLQLPTWAAGPSLALVVIMLFTIWSYAGYDAVIYLAGLGNIDRELVEAAEIDGASSWQVFRHITFPLLSPTTYFLSLIAVIGTFKAFTQIWVMTVAAGGGSTALGTTDTLSVVIFREFYGKLRYGYASALAFVLFAVILGLTLLNNRLQGSRVFYG